MIVYGANAFHMEANSMHEIKTGAGRYFQGENVIEQIGGELKRLHKNRAYIIGGKKALAAAKDRLTHSLDNVAIDYTIRYFTGHCTVEEIDDNRIVAQNFNADCIIGVGGGKAMDVSKAIGALMRLPVFTVPTIASTCAAFAPLSIIYNDSGQQVATCYHDDEVSGVFVDLSLLSSAPPRFLAAGIADAFAKTCEYSSMFKEIKYGDTDIGKYFGYRLAQISDEVLLTCSEKAYYDNTKGIISQVLSDVIFSCIAVIGVVSGFGGFSGRTGSRFAIAHGFNEAIRGFHIKDTSKWLHGEVVGVGVMAQLYANGVSKEYIAKVKELFIKLNLPTTLTDLDLNFNEEQLSNFELDIITRSKCEKKYHNIIRQAIQSVR